MTSPTRVVLKVAHRSDPGRDPDKQVNEDSCAYAEVAAGHLLVVCDGMGGHMSGKEASTRAVQTILHDMSQAAAGVSPGAVLKSAIEHAGSVVFELGGPGQNLLRPGSTCVALLVHAGGAEVAHVGDSRGYMIRENQIYPLTRDHSMVRQMVDAGVLSEEAAMRHPDANKITRALGMRAAVEVELRPEPVPLLRNDLFLLASDGLTDLVMPHEMLSLVQQSRASGGLEHACEQLVALANHRGGHDNITVLVGSVAEVPAVRAAQPTVPGAPDSDQLAPPMTMPDLPVLGSGPNGAVVAPQRPELHPTVVDGDGGPLAPNPVAAPAPAAASKPAAPASTDAHDESDDEPGRKRVLWISVGAALVLLGLILVLVSMWWALAAGSSSLDPLAPVALRVASATAPPRCSAPSADFVSLPLEPLPFPAGGRNAPRDRTERGIS